MAYTSQLVSSHEEFRSLQPEWADFLSGPVDGATLYNDHQFIESLMIADERLDPFVILLRRSGTLVAIAPFVLRKAPYGLWLSVRQLASIPARILDGCGGAFLMTRDGEEADKVAAVFDRLDAERLRFDLIRYQALSPESPIWDHFRCVDSKFSMFPMNEELNQRHLIDLNGTFDEFLQNLSRGTRKSLKRQWRRVHQNSSPVASVDKVETEEQVDAFLSAVDHVDSNTWQAKTFDLGSRCTPAERRRFKILARSGLLRSYLLRFDSTPVAFEVGFQYRSDYLSHETGYDQRFKAYGPGVILLLEVLRDLFSDREVLQFDFGFGDLPQKRSLSHRQEPVGSFVIVRHSRWRHIVQAQRFLNRIDAAVRNVLVHSNLDRFVRRLLKHQR